VYLFAAEARKLLEQLALAALSFFGVSTAPAPTRRPARSRARRHALALEAEDVARLRAGGDLHLHLAVRVGTSISCPSAAW
jgi:hypothetical protein